MTFDKNNPFSASLSEREVLNHEGSDKCTVHLSLDITGSGLSFRVGDSVAVYPTNSPLLVDEMLSIFNATQEQMITDPKTSEKLDLKTYFSKKVNLAKVTKKWIQFACDHTTSSQDKEALEALLEAENKEALKTFCSERQLWDFLKELDSFNAPIEDCAPLFSPMLPRFYSIASSPLSNPNRIDLLIAYIKYTTNQHLRHGVASHYLCEMAPLNSFEIPLYVHPAKNFTLPEDSSKPIIMIGPGTGVAPFRGFMQERIAQNATGDHWLFFGECHQKTDFYYESYWLQLQKEEKLKLSLAFSRDQDHKVYVQHKMFEEAEEFWKWLVKGAIVYVCGDATYMAKDVDLALHKIIEEQGGKTPDEAKAYVKEMRASSRYLRDVY